jgi:glucose/arabinose dehydrogenase
MAPRAAQRRRARRRDERTARPEDGKGLKGWFFKRYQKKAGGAVPSANRITLLRDADGDGIAGQRAVFASGLSSPFGMALVGDVLYIANSDALVRLPYATGEVTTAATPVKVVDLPGGPLNHHWTKNVIASRDGKKLHVAVGSNSMARGIASGAAATR